MTESQLTRKVVQSLKKNFGPKIWFYKVNDNFTSGLPDIVMCYKGIFIGIELKVGKNKPTKLQNYTAEQICAAGGYYFICRSVDEVLISLITVGVNI